jgi:serine/threonine-protein kinase RsbW
MSKNVEILSFKSDKSELKKVEIFLRAIFDRNQLPEEFFNKVLLCVSEAVVNSIVHGNKNMKSKQVSVIVSCDDDDLTVEVIDEGEGFDFTRISDPTTAENIRKERGRGIFIMRSLSNELIFKNAGKCVEFKIDLH